MSYMQSIANVIADPKTPDNIRTMLREISTWVGGVIDQIVNHFGDKPYTYEVESRYEERTRMFRVTVRSWPCDEYDERLTEEPTSMSSQLFDPRYPS